MPCGSVQGSESYREDALQTALLCLGVCGRICYMGVFGEEVGGHVCVECVKEWEGVCSRVWSAGVGIERKGAQNGGRGVRGGGRRRGGEGKGGRGIKGGLLWRVKNTYHNKKSCQLPGS